MVELKTNDDMKVRSFIVFSTRNGWNVRYGCVDVAYLESKEQLWVVEMCEKATGEQQLSRKEGERRGEGSEREHL